METTTRTLTVKADGTGRAVFTPGKGRCQLVIGPTTPAAWALQFSTQPDNTNGVGIPAGINFIKLTRDDMWSSLDDAFTCIGAPNAVFCAIETAYRE